jgi:iron(II)-dependent oxidoreductase
VRSRFRNVQLWLDDYYIARYEARARDQERFMNAGALPQGVLDRMAAERSDTGCTVRRAADGRYYRPKPKSDLPATNLSWEMAELFAHWMGFRLPTEAEWQKAARGGERRIWPWGDRYPDDTYAHFVLTKKCNPVPVDSLPKGRSYYGLYNMSGNVSEHVGDWYNEDVDANLKDGERNPQTALQGTAIPYDIPQRIAKGGGWRNPPRRMAIAARQLVRPAKAKTQFGVRFALDVDVVTKLLQQGKAFPVEKQP